MENNKIELFSNEKKEFQPSNSLENMKQILIKDLEIDNIHYNNFILLQIRSNLLSMASKQFLSEDENNSRIHVSIYNFDTCFTINSFKIGKYIIIKEPYYKIYFDGTNGIRVDNPNNVILLNDINDAYNYILNESGDILQNEKNGDNIYEKKNYLDAIELYEKGLKSKIPENLSEEDINLIKGRIYQKIALSSLNIRAYNFCLENCEKSLNLIPNNSIVFICKIKALFGLKKFIEAENTLIECKNYLSKEKYKNLKELMKKYINHTNGIFDFNEMLKEEKTNFYIDIIDYINNKISFDFDNKHGNKLIAKEVIKKGELLLVNKAIEFFRDLSPDLPYGYNEESPQGIMANSLLKKLKLSKIDFENILTLYNSDDNINKDERKEKNSNCSYEHLYYMIYFDMYKARSHFFARYDYGFGLWEIPSFLNHDCNANTIDFCIGDIFILFAQRDILIGEEITKRYIPYGMDYFKRNEIIIDKFYFECDCDLCQKQLKLYTENNYYKKIAELYYKIKKSNSDDKKFELIKETEKYIQDNILEFNSYEIGSFYLRIGLCYISPSKEEIKKKIEESFIKSMIILDGKNFQYDCLILNSLLEFYSEFGEQEKYKKIKNKIINKVKCFLPLPYDFIIDWLDEKLFSQNKINKTK